MDENRRNFLKILLIGGGTLVVGKILSPLSSFFDDSLAKNKGSTLNGPSAFKIVENKQILSIYDSSGEEVFQIDKSA